MICRFCGNENNDSSVNCFICGKPLQSNIATSLVNLGGGDENTGTYAINNQNDPYANRFASDTGGGPSIGPQSFSAQIMAGETTKKSGGTSSLLIVILILAALAALVWFLLLRDGAPLASLLGGSGSSAASAADAVAEAEAEVQAAIGTVKAFLG